MYETCTVIIIHSVDEIKEIIERFYKAHGRTAEAAGAESMMPYIENRDKRIQELEDVSNHHYSELDSIRRERDKWKSEADNNHRLYSNTMEQRRQADIKVNEYRKFITELTKVKGFSRFVPKKLREQIKNDLS